MIDFPLQGMMIGPDGVPIPIPVEETKLEMDGYFEAGYEDEYQEEDSLWCECDIRGARSDIVAVYCSLESVDDITKSDRKSNHYWKL